MEIVRSHLHRNISTNDAVNTLPLYRSAPPLEVRLEDFELYAMDRLRVLKGISDGLSRGKKPDEMEQLVKSRIYDNLNTGFSNKQRSFTMEYPLCRETVYGKRI